MKETYSRDMMLCFVQGFECSAEREANNNIDSTEVKKPMKKVSLVLNREDRENRSMRLEKSNSGDNFLKRLPEVKRSLSDRFSIIGDGGGGGGGGGRRRDSRRLIAIRKTRSTGNFVGAGGGASGGGGGSSSCSPGVAGAPRSAPATPLQIEPSPRHPQTPSTKSDKAKPQSSLIITPENNEEELPIRKDINTYITENAQEQPQQTAKPQGSFIIASENNEEELPIRKEMQSYIAVNAQEYPQQTNAVKQLSSSAPSVRVSGVSGGGGAGSGDSGESKVPSKGRQKKFLRNFPQVGPDERVLNYYSCALVGDILLQGHLYITKNYFAFYSNVFGYVTKLLIPTTSVLRVSKEKMARIIPNAVGVCTRDERHVFGSLLSRDSTYKLMLHVWKAASVPEFVAPVPTEELRISEVELDASEYSPEDESSSGGGESTLHPRCTRRARPTTPPHVPLREDSIIASVKSSAVIQPTLLLGASAPDMRGAGRGSSLASVFLILLAICLAASALVLGRNLYLQRNGLTIPTQSELMRLRSADLYGELLAWQARLHSQAATEVHGFLNTNLHLLAKVRQSLEALSTMILADVDKHAVHADVLNMDSTPMPLGDNPPEAGVS